MILSNDIFFLSIRNEYVQMILDGGKRWEFRRNSNFGILPSAELAPGSILFLVSTFPAKNSVGKILCVCRVSEIIRGSNFQQYFSDRDSGHWKEAGCEDNSVRDWYYFKSNILNTYKTAVGLKPFSVFPSVDCTTIRHKTKKAPWRGYGLTPIDNLKNYTVGEIGAKEYFSILAHDLLYRLASDV